MSREKGIRMDEWRPLIICFACKHSPCDASEVAEIEADVRIVRLECAGRINSLFVLQALRRGADGVLVTGCAPTECRLSGGAYQASRRLPVLQQLLLMMGLESERFEVLWTGRNEAGKFKEAVRVMAESVKEIGPNSLLREEL